MNDAIRIVPTGECYLESLNRTVGVVARERRDIGFVEGPPIDSTRSFVRRLLDGNGVQRLAINGDEVVGWCDIVRKRIEGFRHGGTMGMGVLPRRFHSIGGWASRSKAPSAVRASSTDSMTTT